MKPSRFEDLALYRQDQLGYLGDHGCNRPLPNSHGTLMFLLVASQEFLPLELWQPMVSWPVVTVSAFNSLVLSSNGMHQPQWMTTSPFSAGYGSVGICIEASSLPVVLVSPAVTRLNLTVTIPSFTSMASPADRSPISSQAPAEVSCTEPLVPKAMHFQRHRYCTCMYIYIYKHVCAYLIRYYVVYIHLDLDLNLNNFYLYTYTYTCTYKHM